MKALILTMLVANLMLTGCCSKWPEVGPRTYSGTVVNAASGRPVEGVEVEAMRPAYNCYHTRVAWYPLGTASSDADGRFSLTTEDGWARFLSTNVHSLVGYDGYVDVTRESTDALVIKLYPKVHAFAGRSTDPESRELASLLEEMVKRIVDFHDINSGQPYRSMNGYLAVGVLTQADVDILKAHPDLFRDPGTARADDKVLAYWGERDFVYLDAETPIAFRDREPVFPDAP